MRFFLSLLIPAANYSSRCSQNKYKVLSKSNVHLTAVPSTALWFYRAWLCTLLYWDARSDWSFCTFRTYRNCLSLLRYYQRLCSTFCTSFMLTDALTSTHWHLNNFTSTSFNSFQGCRCGARCLCGRMPDSQSSEPGFESPLLPFRRLSIFVLSIDAPVDSAV